MEIIDIPKQPTLMDNLRALKIEQEFLVPIDRANTVRNLISHNIKIEFPTWSIETSKTELEGTFYLKVRRTA